MRLFTSLFFCLFFLPSLNAASSEVERICHDSLKPAKIVLLYDSVFTGEPENFTVRHYNAFRKEGSDLIQPLGKDLKNLIPHLEKNERAMKLIKKIKRTGKIGNFFIGWSACFLICTLIFFKFGFVLGWLVSTPLLVIGILGWMLFNNRAGKLFLKAVKQYNEDNGYGAVTE